MGYYIFSAAGKAECCSEGGGRHWTISAPDGSLDAVDSGDLVIVGQLVGVALTDYDTDTDMVVLDTVGCHELEVAAKTNGGGATAIAIGDWLYYDGGAGEIYKWDHATALGADDYMIGQSMAWHDTGDDETICVKLQPCPSLRA
jgi:predicted RecA/RadA family phage recombinase